MTHNGQYNIFWGKLSKDLTKGNEFDKIKYENQISIYNINCIVGIMYP
jgi:hypothetical protein